MTVVTVQSSHAGHTINVQFDSQANFVLAEQIAFAISMNVASKAVSPVFSEDGCPSHLHKGQSGVFFQNSNGVTYLPSGYDAVVVTAQRATVFGSRDSNEAILAGNGDLTFVAHGGSGTLVAGGGNDDIQIANDAVGPWLIATGNGQNTIVAAGKGNDTINPGAGHNLITLGRGNDFLQLTGYDTITAERGRDKIDGTDAKNTIINGGSANIVFIGGSGSVVIQGGEGSDTVYGGSGTMSVRGGSAGQNLLFAGTGAATLFGGGSGDQLYAEGTHAQTLYAGSGNETLSAALSTGNDTFTFVRGRAGGTDLILGFKAADKIHLSRYGSNAIEQALASQHISQGSVTITLSDDTRITFAGVTSLTSTNFV